MLAQKLQSGRDWLAWRLCFAIYQNNYFPSSLKQHLNLCLELSNNLVICKIMLITMELQLAVEYSGADFNQALFFHLVRNSNSIDIIWLINDGHEAQWESKTAGEELKCRERERGKNWGVCGGKGNMLCNTAFLRNEAFRPFSHLKRKSVQPE